MTVLNFPASPAVNDTYTENNVTYTWNGSYWDANNTGSLDDIYVEVAGDVMTGNLQLPGGGGNTAALQKQEIELLIDAAGGGGTGPTDLYWERDAGALSPKVSTDNVNIGNGNITLAADGGAYLSGGIHEFRQDSSVIFSPRPNVGGPPNADATIFTLASDTQPGEILIDALTAKAIAPYGAFSVRKRATDSDTPIISSQWRWDDQILLGGLIPDNPNIQLNGTDGSANYLGRIWVDRTSSGLDCFVAKLNGTTTANIRSDGTIQVGGTIGSAPNIELHTDGSINASGTITSGKIDINNRDTDGVIIKDEGEITLMKRRDKDPTLTVFSVLKGDASQTPPIRTAEIKLDGSSQFAGNMAIGTTGSFTPSTPAISLNATGGDIFAKGGVLSSYTRAKRDLETEQIPLFYGTNTNSGSDENVFHVGSSGISLGTSMTYAAGLVTDYTTRINLDGSATFASGKTFILSDGYTQVERNNVNGTLPAFKVTGKVGGSVIGRMNFACNGELKLYDGSSNENITLRSGDGSAVFKGIVQTAGGVVTPSMVLQLEADDPTKYTTEVDEEGNETQTYIGATLDVKESIETAVAARAAMRETFQELLVAVQSATDFGELKSAMLVALEDYAA